MDNEHSEDFRIQINFMKFVFLLILATILCITCYQITEKIIEANRVVITTEEHK